MKEKTAHTIETVRFMVNLFGEMASNPSMPTELKKELELHVQAGLEILHLSDKLTPQHVDSVIDQMVSGMTDRMETHLKPLFEKFAPYKGGWAAA